MLRHDANMDAGLLSFFSLEEQASPGGAGLPFCPQAGLPFCPHLGLEAFAVASLGRQGPSLQPSSLWVGGVFWKGVGWGLGKPIGASPSGSPPAPRRDSARGESLRSWPSWGRGCGQGGSLEMQMSRLPLLVSWVEL